MQAQASRYADTAALFQALGGGWWHRQDLTADDHGNSSDALVPARRSAAVLAFSGCSSKVDNTPATVTATNPRLTDAQRQNIQLYTVAPSRFRRTVETTAAVDFDNDQATSVLAPFSGPVSRTARVASVTR